MLKLKKNGIQTRYFFSGMHLQPSLKKFGCNMAGSYPVSDKLKNNGLYLPSGSSLSGEDIKYICSIIERKF